MDQDYKIALTRFDATPSYGVTTVRLDCTLSDGVTVSDEVTVPLDVARSIQWHVDQAWDAGLGQRIVDKIATLRKQESPLATAVAYTPKYIPEPTPEPEAAVEASAIATESVE